MTQNTSSKTGLVLSGGAARGIAHIGVLQALEEADIEIHHVAGTSMGAIVGAFFAAGIPPKGMLEILKNDRRITERFRLKLPTGGGLLNMHFLAEILDEYIGVDSIEALKKPLTIAASNLNSGECEFFRKGSLLKAVAASAAIPVLFAPQVVDGKTYVDGGLTNNLPVDGLPKDCDLIIGVHVNYQEDLGELDGVWAIAGRCFSMAIYHTVRDDREKCHLLIEPPETKEFGLFAFHEAEELYRTGYEAAQKELEKFLA